jgi:predicted anti-sigma-YlaC factor YlaD
MMQGCRSGFDQTLLSGHLDSELTQADNQRVRLHLEDCTECRALMQDLLDNREAAMATPFPVPLDEEWQEAPRATGSKGLRLAGWVLVTVFVVGAGGMAIRGLLAGEGQWFEKLLISSLLGGGTLLFLSVLLDRVKALKTDRYRGVNK